MSLKSFEDGFSDTYVAFNTGRRYGKEFAVTFGSLAISIDSIFFLKPSSKFRFWRHDWYTFDSSKVSISPILDSIYFWIGAVSLSNLCFLINLARIMSSSGINVFSAFSIWGTKCSTTLGFYVAARISKISFALKSEVYKILCSMFVLSISSFNTSCMLPR